MNSQFTNIEFAGMMYNPTKISDRASVFRAFKDLAKHRLFKKPNGYNLDNEKVMRYIMCMYDKNTPYRHKYPDVLKRKIEIAHDVGFPINDSGIFNDPVEDFLKGKNKVINRKIVEFVRIHRNFKYSFLVGIENSYYNVMLEVMDGATKRISDLREIQEELENTMVELMNDDNNPHIRDAVLRYMEEERLALRPEDIALKIANGEEPITAEEIK